jgi:hypothetical protein
MSEQNHSLRRICGRTVVAALVLVSLLLSGGCGHSGPETVAIQGKLTFEGGKVPPHCTVYFQPQQAAKGLPLRPANSKIDDQGRFTVTSFRRGDGLVPGTYGVTVEYFQPKPGGDPAREDGWVRHSKQLGELTIAPGSKTVTADFSVPK